MTTESSFDKLSREEKALVMEKLELIECKKRLKNFCVLCGRPILPGFGYRRWNTTRPAHSDCIKHWTNEARSRRLILKSNQMELRKRRASPMSIPEKIQSLIKENGASTWGDITKSFGGARKKEARQALDQLILEGVLTTYIGRRNTVPVAFYELEDSPLAQSESLLEEVQHLRKEVRQLRAFKNSVLRAVQAIKRDPDLVAVSSS